MVRRSLIVSILILAGSISIARADQLKPEEKRALEAKPAVALVRIDLKTRWTVDGVPYTLPTVRISGTGFFFHPDGYLVTNGHVVQFANMNSTEAAASRQAEMQEIAAQTMADLIRQVEKKTGKAVTDDQKQNYLKKAVNGIQLVAAPIITVVLANGKSVTAEILQYSPPMDDGKDVAILKVPGSNYATVPLGDSEHVRLQDATMVMGYPGAAKISEASILEASATNGHISAIKTSPMGLPILQTDTAITHGNSGGPAFNEQGQVIGIATLGSEVQGFNFLVPINTAMEFVRQTGVKPAQGSFDEHWDRGLDLYDAGNFRGAITEFDNVLQFMPDFSDAKRYRASALVGEDHLTIVQKFVETVGTTGIYALAAVLLVGATLIILLRKSQSVPQPAIQKTKVAGTNAAGHNAGVSPNMGGAQPPPIGTLSYGSIQFTSGPLSGRTFKIGKEGLWIGRDPRCGAVVTDDTVSGEHAWIVPVDGSVVVIDKGSSNGTYVNSVDSTRISKVGLKNGDRIFIGKKGPVATYFVN